MVNSLIGCGSGYFEGAKGVVVVLEEKILQFCFLAWLLCWRNESMVMSRVDNRDVLLLYAFPLLVTSTWAAGPWCLAEIFSSYEVRCLMALVQWCCGASYFLVANPQS